MKINPQGRAGQALISWGVTERDLRAASFFKCNLQFGGAITLALPMGRCIVLPRSKYLKPGPDGELPVDGSLALIRHELCHVAQARQWGFFGYWRRQLWARVKSRSLLAANSDAERPCYEAGAAARDALAKMPPR
jgi:hypothetical protein